MVGFTMSEIREQSLLNLFITKLRYRVEDFNTDALETLNRITIPPGLADRLPDNMLNEGPGPCDAFSPCDLAQ